MNKIRSYYRQLFLSPTTAVVSAICIFLLCIATIAFGSQTGQLGAFDYFDHVLRLLLTLFLFYGYRKHDLLAMQAGCCGLLVSLVYYQGSYVMNDLFGLGSTYFMGLGFWGSFFLACQLMVLILECFFLVNHFETFILRKRDFMRITINQIAICVLLGFLILLLFVISRLMTSVFMTAYFTAYDLCLIATYILIGCSELIIALDAEEEPL